MQQPDGSVNHMERIAQAVSDLQWAHETLVRLTQIVHRNGLIGERLIECVVQMQKSVVLLEGLIQEHLKYARRRRDDSQFEGESQI